MGSLKQCETLLTLMPPVLLIDQCVNCIAAKLECHTTQKLSKRSSPKSYVQSMEARLQELEAEVVNLRRERDELRASATDQDHRVDNGTASTLASTSTPGGPLEWPNRPENIKGHPIDGGDHDHIVREVGRMVKDPDGIDRFMGSSSGIYFLGTAFGSFQASFGSNENMRPRLDDLFVLDSKDRLQDLLSSPDQEVTLSLPDVNVAETLASVFFQYVHPIFPVLHRPTFTESLKLLYVESSTIESRRFLPQFFAVLALGHKYRSLASRANGEDPSYLRSFFLAKHQGCFAAGPDDLFVVQTFVLESLLLDLHGERNRSMQIIGKASRLAIGLGMHRNSRRFSYGPLIAAMRIRVFWCIYMLDMFTASVAGIPKSIRDYDLDIDEPFDVDDENTTASAFLTGLPGEPTEISGFISICKLSKILSQILEILYTTTDRRRAVAKMTLMQRLLNQWQDQRDGFKSSHLVRGHDAQRPRLHDVYEQLLCDYCRWLIHRPAMSFPPSSAPYKQALAVCAEAASAMINTASPNPEILSLIPTNPGAHSFSIWSAGVTTLFQYWDLQSRKASAAEDLERVRIEMQHISENCVAVLKSISESSQPGSWDRLRNLEYLIRTTFTTTSLDPVSGAANKPNGSGAKRNLSAIDPELQNARPAASTSDLNSTLLSPGRNGTMHGFANNLSDPNVGLASSFDIMGDFNLDENEFYGSDWFPLGFSPEKVQLEIYDLMQGSTQPTQHGYKRRRIS